MKAYRLLKIKSVFVGARLLTAEINKSAYQPADKRR